MLWWPSRSHRRNLVWTIQGSWRDFVAWFPDDATCLAYLAKLRLESFDNPLTLRQRERTPELLADSLLQRLVLLNGPFAAADSGEHFEVGHHDELVSDRRLQAVGEEWLEGQ